ncbi:hypothetical protein F5J12DRAFT_498017 [Pisolithus orientalis]|uniref:uncharacterized protein n=1 Tax=Pisolithus orientalis TaxID=936130 RepID=UPI002224B769|nr:uncharacterized protein F5J12DRAFT_498017 [Pisolithus orientalis]KAI6020020.1 hypothetical protein F5J12DRAFT_498017 [Pisolithus orientalis]
MATITPLPPYPSTQARKSFSASQLAHFHLNVARALEDAISLPPAKRDTPATRAFISTYAGDAAHQVLQGLIWESSESLRFDENIYQRVLILAEKLASSPPGLDICTVLDLCVAFAERSGRLRDVLAAALIGTPSLPSTFVKEVVPAFTAHLSPARSSGLYALRKTADCLLSLLRPCPPELVRPFAHNRDFVLTLGRAYDEGLSSMARSYGGIRNVDDGSRTLDDWERVWIETKVALVDAFHVIVKCLVADLSAASGHQRLSAEMDRAFGIVNVLLETTTSGTQQSASSEGGRGVPFLDRPLITDYQHAYDFNQMLFSALRSASREDARTRSLDAALRALRVQSSSVDGTRDPGALKLVLRSPGISPLAQKDSRTLSKGKWKARERSPPLPVAPSAVRDTDTDLKITQVLDIFPDHSPGYIRKLLEHPSYPFRGNAERVIEALLEGTAPAEAELETDTDAMETFAEPRRISSDLERIERRNVFDDEVMDISRLHCGKKRHDEPIFLHNKTERERMKADILRRTQIIIADEDDEGEGEEEVAYMDDLDGFGDTSIRVTGDGEDENSSDENGESAKDPVTPETILELAYIRDPKLFARDAETRRSKARAELKSQTGWSDEQIEGWRIMLERNPKKDRILQKHEFQRNRMVEVPLAESSGSECHPPSGAPSRQRGRKGSVRGRALERGCGRGGGRGGSEIGSGGGNEGRSGDESGSRSGNRGMGSRGRALKDKHKASAANHNRKRGHDKKMARAGVGPTA